MVNSVSFPHLTRLDLDNKLKSAKIRTTTY